MMLLKRFPLEYKYICGQGTYVGSYRPLNRFDFLGLASTLKKDGYTVEIQNYLCDSKTGALTSTAEIWRAYKGNIQFTIYFQAHKSILASF